MTDTTPEKTAEELQLEQDVLEAITGDGVFAVSATLGSGDDRRAITLNFRWPDMDDEQQIALLTARFSNGLTPESLSDADFQLARSRAVIEVLSEGPYGDEAWLPPTSEKLTHKGKKALRPDTSKVRSRAALASIGNAYYAIYNKYQNLVLDL